MTLDLNHMVKKHPKRKKGGGGTCLLLEMVQKGKYEHALAYRDRDKLKGPASLLHFPGLTGTRVQNRGSAGLQNWMWGRLAGSEMMKLDFKLFGGRVA